MIPPICYRSERADHRRRQLTHAARMLFAEKGFHATAMAEIAERSGVKMGQIYRDFANKEAIVAAIAAEEMARIVDSGPFAAAIDAGDRQAVLREIEALFEEDDDPLLPEIFAEASRNPRIAEIVRTVDAGFRDALERALAILAPGASRAAERSVLAEFLLTMMAGHCSRVGAGCACFPLSPGLRALIGRELAALG